MAQHFFTTLVASSVDKAQVADDGGETVTITGQFLDALHTVAILTPAGEVPCYMGKSGEGVDGRPDSPTELSFAAPPLPLSPGYDVVVRSGSQTASVLSALGSRNRSWGQTSLSLRQVLPPVLEVGPRDLGAANSLYPNTVAMGAIPDQTPTVAQLYTFTPATNVQSPAWTLETGPLPAGVTLNPATGVISGIPVSSDLSVNDGLFSGISIRATGTNGTVLSNVFSLAIQGVALSAPVWYSAMDDDPVGGIITDGVAGNNGALNGAPTQADGAVARSIELLEATSDYANVPSASFPSVGFSDYTLSVVVEKVTTTMKLVGKRSSAGASNPGWVLDIDPGSMGITHCDGSAPALFGSVPAVVGVDGQFHSYIVAVDRTKNANFYLDGAAVGILNISAQPASVDSVTDFLIGAGQSFTLDLASDARFDEVALFTYRLTLDQAATVAWLSRIGISLQTWIGF